MRVLGIKNEEDQQVSQARFRQNGKVQLLKPDEVNAVFVLPGDLHVEWSGEPGELLLAEIDYPEPTSTSCGKMRDSMAGTGLGTALPFEHTQVLYAQEGVRGTVFRTDYDEDPSEDGAIIRTSGYGGRQLGTDLTDGRTRLTVAADGVMPTLSPDVRKRLSFVPLSDGHFRISINGKFLVAVLGLELVPFAVGIQFMVKDVTGPHGDPYKALYYPGGGYLRADDGDDFYFTSADRASSWSQIAARHPNLVTVPEYRGYGEAPQLLCACFRRDCDCKSGPMTPDGTGMSVVLVRNLSYIRQHPFGLGKCVRHSRVETVRYSSNKLVAKPRSSTLEEAKGPTADNAVFLSPAPPAHFPTRTHVNLANEPWLTLRIERACAADGCQSRNFSHMGCCEVHKDEARPSRNTTRYVFWDDVRQSAAASVGCFVHFACRYTVTHIDSSGHWWTLPTHTSPVGLVFQVTPTGPDSVVLRHGYFECREWEVETARVGPFGADLNGRNGNPTKIKTATAFMVVHGRRGLLTITKPFAPPAEIPHPPQLLPMSQLRTKRPRNARKNNKNPRTYKEWKEQPRLWWSTDALDKSVVQASNRTNLVLMIKIPLGYCNPEKLLAAQAVASAADDDPFLTPTTLKRVWDVFDVEGQSFAHFGRVTDHNSLVVIDESGSEDRVCDMVEDPRVVSEIFDFS